mgnify:CR=1 FL=1
MADLIKEISDLQAFETEIKAEKLALINKAMGSNDPQAILKAQAMWHDVQEKSSVSQKTIIFDPFNVATSLNFKDNNSGITYNTLRRMARTPIIRAIIGTRIEQVSAYAQPQARDYEPGFIIRRKHTLLNKSHKGMNKQELMKAQWLTDFIVNCGNSFNNWVGDDFDSFIRKFTSDSLTLDQGVFEVVRDRKGRPISFSAEDGAQFRKAPDWNDPKFLAMYKKQGLTLPDRINGYYPAHVQVQREQVQAEFYPWELCFGIRNPSSDIYVNGYGTSELEDLIRIVTWMLNGDDYNGKFFSQGSSPKGILKVVGQTNEARLAEFRQQWMAMVQGVQNAWRTPILEGDKVDWIDLQKSNQDMEFAKWQEYLIRLSCAIYKIAPDEIGFDITKTTGGGLSTGGPQDKLEYSKDKGLKPLLKYIQKKINKFLINPLDPEYEFVFVGMEEDESAELEADIKKLGNFMTINEIRDKRGLVPIEGGDIIANQYFMQSQQAQMFGDPSSNAAVDEDEDQGTDGVEKALKNNPLLQSFIEYQNHINL